MNIGINIITNPNIMMGKPVIDGTRITVELIIEKLAAGETFEDILEAHPNITKAGIYAALNFAAKKNMKTNSNNMTQEQFKEKHYGKIG
jgi:uncharacterized protein (DUF433 family)